VRLTFDVKLRAAFQARGHRSGGPCAATNDPMAGANCKRHDAALVLFGRAASAADQVRRLASLNATLGAGPKLTTLATETGRVILELFPCPHGDG
jgi:hypothetical protein